MEAAVRTKANGDKNEIVEYNYVRPLCDISETPDHYHVALQMPGVAKGDVTVQVKNEHLLVTGYTSRLIDGETIRAEIGHRNYRRIFSLGRLIDREKIEARWQDGYLILKIAKKEEAKPREIKIN